MLPDPHDTIVALSSAAGPGGRAVVRLSGRDALAVADKVVSSAEPWPPLRGVRRGHVSLPGVASPWPVEAFLWRGPRSYTGQHVVELHTLSCPPLTDLLISILLQSGARAAQAGEFTLRAFLAGKLDLVKAEAVIGVIKADSRDELRNALNQLAGGVSDPLLQLRGDLLDLLADVEAGLDFADEDVSFIQQTELLQRLGRALAQVTLLGKQLEKRAVSERAFRVVLAGKPNAGKSSLFNALGGRALVSPTPGTTRDYVVHRLDLDSLTVDLVDTPGRHASAATIEDQAQQLGRDQEEKADLVLWCVEAGRTPDAKEEAQLRNREKVVIGITTKADLANPRSDWPATSARNGKGLSSLRHIIADQARHKKQPALAPSLSRCRHHVASCLDHLRRAHSVVLFEDPPEILALEVRGAIDQLGEMLGAVSTNDLLDRIFSRFCIGK